MQIKPNPTSSTLPRFRNGEEDGSQKKRYVNNENGFGFWKKIEKAQNLVCYCHVLLPPPIPLFMVGNQMSNTCRGWRTRPWLSLLMTAPA
jgi:hypothetical protein